MLALKDILNNERTEALQGWNQLFVHTKCRTSGRIYEMLRKKKGRRFDSALLRKPIYQQKLYTKQINNTKTSSC